MCPLSMTHDRAPCILKQNYSRPQTSFKQLCKNCFSVCRVFQDQTKPLWIAKEICQDRPLFIQLQVGVARPHHFSPAWYVIQITQTWTVKLTHYNIKCRIKTLYQIFSNIDKYNKYNVISISIVCQSPIWNESYVGMTPPTQGTS